MLLFVNFYRDYLITIIYVFAEASAIKEVPKSVHCDRLSVLQLKKNTYEGHRIVLEIKYILSIGL